MKTLTLITLTLSATTTLAGNKLPTHSEFDRYYPSLKSTIATQSKTKKTNNTAVQLFTDMSAVVVKALPHSTRAPGAPCRIPRGSILRNLVLTQDKKHLIASLQTVILPLQEYYKLSDEEIRAREALYCEAGLVLVSGDEYSRNGDAFYRYMESIRVRFHRAGSKKAEVNGTLSNSWSSAYWGSRQIDSNITCASWEDELWYLGGNSYAVMREDRHQFSTHCPQGTILTYSKNKPSTDNSDTKTGTPVQPLEFLAPSEIAAKNVEDIVFYSQDALIALNALDSRITKTEVDGREVKVGDHLNSELLDNILQRTFFAINLRGRSYKKALLDFLKAPTSPFGDDPADVFFLADEESEKKHPKIKITVKGIYEHYLLLQVIIGKTRFLVLPDSRRFIFEPNLF